MMVTKVEKRNRINIRLKPKYFINRQSATKSVRKSSTTKRGIPNR